MNQTFYIKLLANGFIRILTGVIVCVATIVLVQMGTGYILSTTTVPATAGQLTIAVATAITVTLAYYYFFRAYDKRKIVEFSIQYLVRDMALGMLIGSLLQTLTIAVIYFDHGFQILSLNKAGDILPWMGLSLSAAVGEEIVFRGIIFRITAEKLGNFWALIISSLIFGAAHFFNPGATLLSSLSIAVEAGLLLGVAYMFTQNIWLAVAIHFAWDFVQSGIYGVTTSGKAIGKSLITSRITGPELITGGKFGPEASVQAVLLCFFAALIMLIIIRQRKVRIIGH